MFKPTSGKMPEDTPSGIKTSRISSTFGKAAGSLPEEKTDSTGHTCRGRLKISNSFSSGSSNPDEANSPWEFMSAGNLSDSVLAPQSDSTTEYVASSQCSAFTQYAMFKSRKARLAGLFSDASEIMDNLNMSALTEKLKDLSNKVNSEAFKVQIIGTFKNGKSTFINSFLGQEVLPAYALPCTAVINEVKYSENKRAVLHFKEPIPKVLPKELSSAALQHMKKHKMKNIPPMEIPYDKINDYVVIPMGKNPTDMLLESPYEKVELFWPLDILRNGIEIIDSPGLNEHATRTKVTMDYISKADAVIFVLNATTLCSKEEMSFIKGNLKAQGFEDLFFVINRFDMIPEKEQKRIMQYAKSKLTPFTSFKEDGLYFISARNALDAKIASDEQKLKQSGLPAFEKRLSDYLTLNRGKIKLTSPAKSLNKFLKSDMLGKIIPRQAKMLESPLGDLKEKYLKIKPKLDSLEAKKSLLYKKMMLSIGQCEHEFKLMASRYINEIISSVPVWVNEYTPSVKLGMMASKAKSKAIIDELSAHISEQLERNTTYWQEKELIPIMKERSNEIFLPAQKELSRLMSELYDAGNMLSDDAINSKFETTNLDYDYSSVYHLGEGQLPKTGAMQIAGKTLMVMLSLTNPVALVGVLTVLVVSSSKKGESSALKKIKESVISEVTANFEAATEEFVNSVSDGITKSYKDIANKMIAPLNDEISQVQSQIEVVLANLKAGKTSIDKKKSSLVTNAKKIKGLCASIDTFTKEISAL